jgi:hypothetical protein
VCVCEREKHIMVIETLTHSNNTMERKNSWPFWLWLSRKKTYNKRVVWKIMKPLFNYKTCDHVQWIWEKKMLLATTNINTKL